MTRTTPAPPPGCCTTVEAAHRLGLARKTLDNLRWRGGGPLYLAVGRRVYYRQDDLERWLLAHLRASTSDRDGAAARAIIAGSPT